MKISRTLKSVLFLALGVCASSSGSPQASSTLEDTLSGGLFQEYTLDYLRQRSFELKADLAQREETLVWLLQGINAEVQQRQGEDPRGTFEAINPTELSVVSDSLFDLPPGIEEAPPRIQYQEWSKSQLDEFNFKFYQARLIKDRLIASANSQQKVRMFRWDLESALRAFLDGFYLDAIFQFTEAIECYGYSNTADLHFYRGESFFAIRFVDEARRDYQDVIRLNDPDYRTQAYGRLLVIAGDSGDKAALADLWNKYLAEAGSNPSPEYWQITTLVANYYYAMRDWNTTRDLFGKVPVDMEEYGIARLRCGDGALASLDLDQAEAFYNQVLQHRAKKAPKFPESVIKESYLKLGYIKYLRGEYQSSLPLLEKADGNDLIGEKANLVAAWCWFKLNAYEKALQACRDLTGRFPQTQFYYEVYCLLGFCEEITGQGTKAFDDYQVVMSAMDSRQDYHDFSMEQQAVLEASLNLEQLEPALFLNGRDELFDQYQDLQRRLVTLNHNVQLSEGVKTHPEVVDLVTERSAVIQVIKDQSGIEDKVVGAEDLKLSRDYDNLYNNLTDLQDELSGAIRYYLNRKSLIQREEEQRFNSLVYDTLESRMTDEWEATSKSLASIRAIRDKVSSAGDPELIFALGGIETDLMRIQDRVLGVRQDLQGVDTAPVASEIEWWSRFAYQRHTPDKANYDDFYASQTRLDELDNYISRINEILTERKGGKEEAAQLADAMIPASRPGEPPYQAPPAPMWKSKESPKSEAPSIETIPPDTLGKSGDTTGTPEGGSESAAPGTEPGGTPTGQVNPTSPPPPASGEAVPQAEPQPGEPKDPPKSEAPPIEMAPPDTLGKSGDTTGTSEGGSESAVPGTEPGGTPTGQVNPSSPPPPASGEAVPQAEPQPGEPKDPPKEANP